MKFKNPLDHVLTTAEVAEKLQVTKRQVARLCKANKLIYREAPGLLLILKESVEEYVSDRRKSEYI
ncbi:hypothetical protein Back11_00570 [Paenibacillus baekrokdamisoli]|uniref:Uncharacterized protein n=1 Tax=Paenibacillus baekrokdamisoli TaxID=1712516 RepID=A0A3G9IKL6_9BACL|nr:helix-turn-helix domain-containing protein [Paenibacillus baekrokdamisoli]MBB3069316.1 excisionase family DNA binding protein [Paenibacillus baekrokdamisoli]BBH18712.1 hypothetical protein Back11_00570 [Paenibacillus baekrokdamisoli]